MSTWLFDHHEVLADPDGHWWHIANRYKCADTDDRLYHLWDGTHTADRYEPAANLERGHFRDDPPYQPLEWSAAIKPAAVNGFRVNGVLTEPAEVGRWRGRSCVSDHECPTCGEGTEDAADVVVNFGDGDVLAVEIWCGACGEINEVSAE